LKLKNESTNKRASQSQIIAKQKTIMERKTSLERLQLLKKGDQEAAKIHREWVQRSFVIWGDRSALRSNVIYRFIALSGARIAPFL
jgi:hypothetical protein